MTLINVPGGDSDMKAATSAFEGLLSGEPGKRKAPPKAEAAPQVEQADADAPDLEAQGAIEAADEGGNDEGEEPETRTTSEDDGDEGDAAPEADAEGSDDGSDREFTVKVDGKETKVPVKELIAGYQRTADYTRKTDALAQERRAFAGEKQAVQQERQTYAQILPVLQAQIESSLPPAPDPSLREVDPLEYVLQKDRYDEAVGNLQAIHAEQARVQHVQAHEQNVQLRQALKLATEKLPELIPAWKDKAARERDTPKLREYLKKSGYTDAEINQAYDPRAVATAWKAMRYDALVSGKPKAAPEVVQQAVRRSPAPVTQKPSAVRELSKAKERLASSGRVEDAAAAFAKLI